LLLRIILPFMKTTGAERLALGFILGLGFAKFIEMSGLGHRYSLL